MAPRRGTSNTLGPQDSLAPSGSASPISPNFPRSTSPSSGFTQFLTKPSKWFARSVSASKIPTGTVEMPRSSMSSGRKHKISRPTDPRPILDGYTGPGSRSVLDLSVRPPGSLDISSPQPISTPSSPTLPPSHSQGGLGDLRNYSRRGWSKSADDLGKITPNNLAPIQTSFQDRVAEYRNRSNSSASVISPSSPTPPPLNGRHPFPSVKNVSPSASPPRSATLPTVSISISAPVVDDDDGSSTAAPIHVHTRSHSFTPKHSSKLASSPASPIRKGSGASEIEVRGPEGLNPTRGGVFPFATGGSASSKASQEPNALSPQTLLNRSTTLLTPPDHIIPNEDGLDDSDPRRSSQILYHSGFINRLADVPNHFHHTNIVLTKGWKPFKLELKGSKLYFYKPPGDKSTGIKDLFPTEFVPASLEDQDEADSDLNGGDDAGTVRTTRSREDQGTFGRKKRAFWGRKTHPDLIQNMGKIEKGTFEALVHEMSFATTFVMTQEDGETEAMTDARYEDWKDFASSILLCLPSIVGQNKFESELLRCCEYLVTGAGDNVKEDERVRVGWLAGEYLRYQGIPADLPAWEEWRKETLPNIASAIVPPPTTTIMPTSTSMQALHPSPHLAASPNVDTFSPRPDEPSYMVSLMGALNARGNTPPSPSKKASLDLRNFEHQQTLRPPSHMPWVALEQEGLSRDVLLLLDPHLIARSLILYHRSVFEETPENLTARFVMNSETDASDSQATPVLSSDPLFGSDDQPHWLTKLLLMQILGADTSSGTATSPQISSPGRKSEDRNVQHTSRTHSRSEVISVWTRVGELCRLEGDECSWRAILAALCSRPIARLDKAWKRVDPLALAAIESWIYPSSGGEISAVKQPKITPWGGDVKACLKGELAKARGDGGDQALRLDHFERVRALFESLRTSFSLCPRKAHTEEGEIDDGTHRMVAFWRDMSVNGGGAGSFATKFQRVDQFMSLSLAAEPRRKGLFEPYFWARAPSPTSLLPLLFPEPLPTVTLIDRSQLLRGRVDSDAQDVQFLRGIDGRARLDERRLIDNIDMRDGLNSLSQGGTVIPVYNGDLLLVVQAGTSENPSSRPSSRAPSRPPSSVEPGMEKTLGRAPSIRVKPGSSQGLDRKSSVARRNSLPSISQRQSFVTSEPSSEPPLRVVVHAGTINILVNILVHGLHNVSVSVADDNGEMSLREGMTRDLVVDQAELARVWWNVFRSFISPLVFFELLRKLYITVQPFGSSPPPAEYLHVAGARSEVLETIKEWLTLGGGAQDVLDDTQLYNTLHSFMESTSDHVVFQAKHFEDPHVQQAWTGLLEVKKSLHSVFLSQTMRPPTARGRPLPRGSVHNSGIRTRNLSMREPPDMDRIDADDFVDNLDGMACAAFSNVTEEDLYVTADLLEIQSSDRTGWFSQRDVNTIDEGVEIQTIYSHIQEVDHSSLISELSQDSLYRLLPPGIRSCVRAYWIIRKWIISKIVAPRLGLRARQVRMELLLQAIEVARLRNTNSTPSPGRLVDQICVRSFVEAVTTSAILSIESRMHHRAWQNVGANRGSPCDSLASLLSRPFTQAAASNEPLTPDMGWVMERMLEVIATPDVVEGSTQDSPGLVNFHKRRHLCNLIEKAPGLPGTRRRVQPDEFNRRGFERLNNVEKEVSVLQFDHRGIKDEATREASHPAGGTASAKKAVRPFQKLITLQLEKNRRDKNLRSRLQKEKLHEQTRNEKRDELLNRAMRPRKQGALPQKHRNKKSMSAFLQFMRPISSAFGADISHSSLVKRTPAELDFTPTGKPSLVLSLMDARVVQFINNERSFTFQLDTEDGGHYLLQALNKRDMTKWIDIINRVTKMAAKRRLTYLGNTPKPQLSDHIHNHPIVASRDPLAVFGVELDFLLQREAGGFDVQPGTIPSVIEQCLSEVEARGLSEVGIYRIAGATSEINSLRDAFNRGEAPITRSTDIHAVCDLIKSWFRVLPEPIFPSSSYHDVIQAMQLDNLEDRLSNIRSIIQALPQANLDILKRVSEHLDKVTDFEEHNHMTAEALAIVFSPNLLRAPQNDFVMILANMGHTHKLVKALITHFHVIFDEADPEAEVHSEDEYDSPILEEDEDEEDDMSITDHQNHQTASTYG